MNIYESLEDLAGKSTGETLLYVRDRREAKLREGHEVTALGVIADSIIEAAQTNIKNATEEAEREFKTAALTPEVRQYIWNNAEVAYAGLVFGNVAKGLDEAISEANYWGANQGRIGIGNISERINFEMGLVLPNFAPVTPERQFVKLDPARWSQVQQLAEADPTRVAFFMPTGKEGRSPLVVDIVPELKPFFHREVGPVRPIEGIMRRNILPAYGVIANKALNPLSPSISGFLRQVGKGRN